jgi:hypothetical protein
VEKGEKRRARPAATEDFEALLTTAHAGQPIMNQHDTPGPIRIHASIPHPVAQFIGNDGVRKDSFVGDHGDRSEIASILHPLARKCFFYFLLFTF